MSKGDGQGSLRSAGFTIIETMIVLAVTAALFAAIASSLGGRQNAAEFRRAVQDTQAQIQQIINQVSEGYYPNQSNFNCSKNGSTLSITPGSNDQGTNQGCVFLGKVVQFGVQSTSPEQYRTYTIAGLQGSGIGTGTASLFENADATVVVPAVYLNSDSQIMNYSIYGVLNYGITTLWVHYGNNDIGSIGFLTEPGNLSTSIINAYNSGAEQVDLVPILSTSLGQSLHAAVGSINTSLHVLNDANVNPDNGVQICLVSSGINESGLISIGSNGTQLLVNLSIKNDNTC